jgi:hypothetical protein
LERIWTLDCRWPNHPPAKLKEAAATAGRFLVSDPHHRVVDDFDHRVGGCVTHQHQSINTGGDHGGRNLDLIHGTAPCRFNASQA